MKMVTPAAKSTFMITSMDQARLLADPMKLRIIQEMALEPRTTKQVADLLGEKPTKFYRHVDALRDAGLLVLVAEKPKRGTVEKYYQAVARRFEMHPDLFALPGDEVDAVWNELLASTQADILRALKGMQATPDGDEDLMPCVMKVTVRASEADIKDLRQRLLTWVEDCEKKNRVESSEAQVQWSSLIAFYPDPPK